MSVRRLAEASVQPETFSFNREKAAEAKVWIKKYPEGRQQSAVIPLLMLAQEQDGWVTRPAIEHIAEMLAMPLIRVMEVATFYTQFMLQPVGTKAHVQVCGTTPCMLRGAEDLMQVCRRKINDQQFHRNGEGTLSWEEVECQGTCVNAPMVMIGRDTYEDLTPQRLEEIIDAFEAGKGGDITPGPQIDRIFSAPEGGLTTLVDDTPAPAAKKTGAKRSANPSVDLAKTASEVKPKGKPKAKTVAGGNPTMKVAGTAAGRTTKAKSSQTGGSKAKPSTKTRHEKPAEGGKAMSIMQTADAAKAVTPKAEPPAPVDPASNPTVKLAATARGHTAKKPAPAAAAKPAAIDKPANPDKLTMIAGIGPKIEGILHELGIWTWGQIADWKEAECEWVNGHLSFKGRIEREEWVKQAQALAKGGRDEYVRVFGKEPK